MKTLSGDSGGSKWFKPNGDLFKQSTFNYVQFSIYHGELFSESVGTLLDQSWRIVGDMTKINQFITIQNTSISF